MTTITKMQKYRDALRKWKDNGGLTGAGGSWNAVQRKHEHAPEPSPEAFGIESSLSGLTQQIRKDVLKV